jgi:hypothetical protein
MFDLNIWVLNVLQCFWNIFHIRILMMIFGWVFVAVSVIELFMVTMTTCRGVDSILQVKSMNHFHGPASFLTCRLDLVVMFTWNMSSISRVRVIGWTNVINLQITAGTATGPHAMADIHGFNLNSRIRWFYSPDTYWNLMGMEAVISFNGELKVQRMDEIGSKSTIRIINFWMAIMWLRHSDVDHRMLVNSIDSFDWHKQVATRSTTTICCCAILNLWNSLFFSILLDPPIQSHRSRSFWVDSPSHSLLLQVHCRHWVFRCWDDPLRHSVVWYMEWDLLQKDKSPRFWTSVTNVIFSI